MKNIDLNVIFLDYDGVINIEPDNFGGYLENPEAIYFINKFCKEKKFDIIVTSSWKINPNYKQMLYDSGLDKNIKIIGCTDITFKDRKFEIENYLENHKEIKRYLIIDDAYIQGEIGTHQIQTTYKIGYTKEKYEETLIRYSNLYEKDI